MTFLQYASRRTSPKGSSGTCIPDGVSTFLHAAFTAHQGKAPQDRFVFIEQNDLAPASPILQGGQCKRGIGESRRGGIEPSGGAAVA
jgi:hypothetical protein